MSKSAIIKIEKFQIGGDNPPFIIAEMSGNHNGSLERALEIVEAAASAGAHALKIQTYTAETMTLNLRHGEFFINDPASLWAGNSLYDLYEKAHTPWAWHKEIFERCKKLGMVGFSTPFDATAVDFLEALNVPCYKIASFENTDIPLIRRVASTGKPLIVSTGMATLSEIADIVSTARAAGCRDLILLKCTSQYPADPRDSNIAVIPHMSELFDVPVGLSDHTMGIGAAIGAAALGAVAIEKHFTTSRADGGVDAAFSMEPGELRSLVVESRTARESIGTVFYGPTKHEENSLVFRRTLYIAKDIEEGEVLTAANMRAIRPGRGLSPKAFDLLLGRRVNKKVAAGTPVSWDLIG
ncbi:MAG: pseudaminic acid synthase [Leptospirales bacterium]|nr:pseudaminic acid synthase [Leptospirales bacterium]